MLALGMSMLRMFLRLGDALSQSLPMFNLVCVEVCDEPHPLLIKEMLSRCEESNIDEAYQILKSLWDKGYSSHDIITNIFRVCKNHQMPEFLKLEYIKVSALLLHGSSKLLTLYFRK